ncbi:MAG: hypothetical protein WC606_03415 [Candidatus Absconditabacterales bacterium]
MDIIIRKDGEGYIAEIKGKNALYAFGYSKEEAVSELKNVVDMMVDYYSEEISFQKKIKKYLAGKQLKYAV